MLALRRAGVIDWPPHLLRLIQFGRVVDISRLVEDFGMTPRYSSLETVQTLAPAHPVTPRLLRGGVGLP
jgi:UDP-glucose 4-epimerase